MLIENNFRFYDNGFAMMKLIGDKMTFVSDLNELDPTIMLSHYSTKFDKENDSEVFGTLSRWIDSAQVTVSWGVRYVKVAEFTDEVEMDTLLWQCRHTFNKVQTPPDIRLQYYKTAKKIRKLILVDVEPKGIEALYSCFCRNIGKNNMTQVERFMIELAIPFSEERKGPCSSLFKFTVDEFNKFFPGQEPAYTTVREDYTDSFGNLDLVPLYCASKQQMKLYSGQA